MIDAHHKNNRIFVRSSKQYPREYSFEENTIRFITSMYVCMYVCIGCMHSCVLKQSPSRTLFTCVCESVSTHRLRLALMI